MTDMRDVTWRFLNFAPVASNQRALDDLFAETLRPLLASSVSVVRQAWPMPRAGAGGVVLSQRGMDEWDRALLRSGAYHRLVDPCYQTYLDHQRALTPGAPGQTVSGSWRITGAVERRAR